MLLLGQNMPSAAVIIYDFIIFKVVYVKKIIVNSRGIILSKSWGGWERNCQIDSQIKLKDILEKTDPF